MIHLLFKIFICFAFATNVTVAAEQMRGYTMQVWVGQYQGQDIVWNSSRIFESTVFARSASEAKTKAIAMYGGDPRLVKIILK